MSTLFDTYVKSKYLILNEADPGMDPGLGGAPGSPNPAMGAAPGPETAPNEVPQVTKLTPEGKRFLVELALKALSFDPANITDQDKSIFDETVTPENAEDVLNRIKDIVTGSDVESSADDLE